MKPRELVEYLGQIGRNLPALTEEEWKNIFNFIEYFYAVYAEGSEVFVPDTDWPKAFEILTLLQKIHKEE